MDGPCNTVRCECYDPPIQFTIRAGDAFGSKEQLDALMDDMMRWWAENYTDAETIIMVDDNA